MGTFQATVGSLVTLPLVEDALEVGHVLGDYSVLAIAESQILGDPEDEVGLELLEVNDTTAPGYYEVRLTPDRPGLTYLKVTRGLFEVEYFIQASMPVAVADPALEGDYEVTVESGATPVPGATVRVFNALGTTLVARKTTDLFGKAQFPLEAGQYQVRINKDGHDFSAISPSLITVFPNDNVTPRIDELVPPAASIGDFITIKGQFFHEESTEVVFGAEATVAANFISTGLDTVLVEVPAGLTLLAIPLRIRKPDPDNIGQYLFSNVLTFTRTP